MSSRRSISRSSALPGSIPGLSPLEMEHRIVTPFERQMATSVDNIEHFESQTIVGRSIIKIFFHPRVNIATAMGQVTATSNLTLRSAPPGHHLALIITYSASTVPILQLVLSGDGLSEQELFDFGENFIRNQMATVPGAAIPWPYGGKQRQVSVNVDIPALQAKGLSPVDVINAISAQNLILPSGTVKLGSTEYNVEMNGSPHTIAALNDLPIKTVNGTTIYVRDVATVSDGFSPQINIVRMDGQRGVLLSIYKTGAASTLDIVSQVYDKLPRIAATLPPQLVMTPLFDQSIFVRAAVQGVIREALIAACLTALMILLFLGSWRSTLIIAISIPLSILVSICVLSALGRDHQHHDARRAGARRGHPGGRRHGRDREHQPQPGAGQGDGARRFSTARSRSPCRRWSRRCASASCSCPCSSSPAWRSSCSCRWPKRWSSPCWPLTSFRGPWCRRWRCICSSGHHGEEYATGNDVFSRIQRGFAQRLRAHARRLPRRSALLSRSRLDFRACFSWLLCSASAPIALVLGRDFFPTVDAGLIRLHMRARAGQRVEETARECDRVDNLIRQVIPPADLGNVLDNIGLSNSTINTIL